MTANVAGFYGDDTKDTRFTGPKDEKYFTLVNKKTGEVELWNEELGRDRRVGALNAKTKKWNFDETASGKSTTARDFEVDYFNKPENTKGVINQALKTVERDKINGTNLEGNEKALGNSLNGVSQASTEARDLLNTNQQTIRAANAAQQNQFASLQDGVKASKRTRQNFNGPNGPIIYPITLRDQDQDVLKFTMLEYKPRKFNSKGATPSDMGGFEKRSHTNFVDRKILGSVILPIPGGITETSSVDWGDSQMGPLQAAIANLALNAMMGKNEKVNAQVNNAAEVLQSETAALKSAVGAGILEMATGTAAGGILTRQTGAIMNPNMELLFRKPMLRPFSFSFKLSPRSKQEAQSVVRIIRFFKQGMAAQRTEGQLFLKTPNTFRLKYLHQGRQHRYLNKFKECALMGMTMDYAPDQNYATYEDGVMTQYSMTLNFKELEAVFSDDFEEADSIPSTTLPAEIGY